MSIPLPPPTVSNSTQQRGVFNPLQVGKPRPSQQRGAPLPLQTAGTVTVNPSQIRGSTQQRSQQRSSSPTATPTFTPTLTPTATPTLTPTLTPTATPTLTPTLTQQQRKRAQLQKPGAQQIRKKSQLLKQIKQKAPLQPSPSQPVVVAAPTVHLTQQPIVVMSRAERMIRFGGAMLCMLIAFSAFVYAILLFSGVIGKDWSNYGTLIKFLVVIAAIACFAFGIWIYSPVLWVDVNKPIPTVTTR